MEMDLDPDMQFSDEQEKWVEMHNLDLRTDEGMLLAAVLQRHELEYCVLYAYTAGEVKVHTADIIQKSGRPDSAATLVSLLPRRPKSLILMYTGYGCSSAAAVVQQDARSAVTCRGLKEKPSTPSTLGASLVLSDMARKSI
ncbi:hypothetical protein VOLCADRAFT_87103 [Volvox carteri f. nagariensis]|uniref:Uncharacterized protein n=1 Tax=Volvox carteri f. nagariensis TaxID=3068 RepID=D8TK64_VOLCA|nr:uncharacterized protein VOLCADRAFT_87103 [Volvox carteri f. nagariensis]EFJ52194.1 hypothetical protein VOLCADRAFT_87103 [Volvox carteri f. nagariensis]|eukprot:XP_002946968.1 hypothetical protein VOLCADRAFT_87103 [Volvox carteri f. nagariensis]